ncbi:MAG: isoleucine--tRNA ligase [Actinobacteria bacterium]|nr:isoleucine--tRNA ligase [Actinomycetota bacterium]
MPDPLYRPVDARVSFPALEERVLERWATDRVFERSVTQRKGAGEWVFYEGPPTANGKPGFHHVEARVFKDIFCRYQAMRGRYVFRKAGWDCHGLPVEIEVEKELGITEKRQIEEDWGIEEFVRRCRESVTRYVEDWRKMTDRIGFWLDLDNAYWTMDPAYIETVWWILRQIWDKGLLEEDFKVVPYCPRCETSLSSHEQHQPGAYQDISDPSVYVRFPLLDEADTALLVWTTTPWTLLANMAAAVGTDLQYVKVPDPGREDAFLVLAAERVDALVGPDTEPVATLTGRDLVGRRYEPPFPFVDAGDNGHTVRPGDFVTTEDGSGIVHLAPYGEEDMMVARRDRLPILQVIAPDGHVVPEAGEFAGLWFKDADPKIVESLGARGILYRAEEYHHAYPHCWRCGTPLIYYARKDWYVRTSQIRNDLQASNEETNWQPPSIKYGRFGDWLVNNVDWSLSRDRYWGTPLPIWRCEDEHATCVGSFAELSELSGKDVSGIDPHRPYVDEIVFPCPSCGKEARRVRSVIDAWFDSGSMPFGQWHYPFENEDLFERRFPADFISEAIDQTRGWFYSLLAVSTLVKGQNSYRNVVCLGLLVDAGGRKMSKSLGNMIDPWAILNEQGADALRWYMYTTGSAWSARRVSIEIIQEALRKYLLTLWNTYAFWVTYAALENFDPRAHDIPMTERPEMDRWILAELNHTVLVATEGLDDFDATRAGRRIEGFVDDLSNWYVRRSRRRFWRSAEDADTRAAFQTLWECLVTVAQLTAPFTPFVADEIYTNLAARDDRDSVHLTDWPEWRPDPVDDALRERMQLVRKLVGLGRSARTEAKVRTRQPLRRALVVMPAGDKSRIAALEGLVADELNVKEVQVASGLEELVNYSIKPNFKTLGPRLGPKVKDVAATLARVEPHEFVTRIENDGSAEVEVDGGTVTVEAADLDIRVEGREGFSLARDGPYGIALDLDLDEELIAEGIAREVVREVQELRKSSGLAVEDRIALWLDGSDDTIRNALEQHRDLIAAEVLATDLRLQSGDGEAHEIRLDRGTVRAGLAKS